MEKLKRLGAVFLILIGFGFGNLWSRHHTLRGENILQYGVAEQNLKIQSVSWKEYPAYRELTFSIDGSISFYTKPGGQVTLPELTESDKMEETGRTHKFFLNGSLVHSYDAVTYRLDNGKVTVNIPKTDQENIISSISNNSYYLSFHENEDIHTAGWISVSDTTYVPWTADEIKNSAINMEVYLSAFSLSDTYDNTTPLHQKSAITGIELKKETGNYLNCTLQNNTEKVWNHEQLLPHIELWYKGIWLELNTPFDDNLTIGSLNPSETKHYEIPQETIKQYPTLFPGIYRLVIYGENGEFATSDSFYYESID